MNINGVSLNSTTEVIQTNEQQIAQLENYQVQLEQTEDEKEQKTLEQKITQLQQRIQTIQSSANSQSFSQVQTTKQKSEPLNSKQKEDKLEISQEGLEKLKQMQTSGEIV